MFETSPGLSATRYSSSLASGGKLRLVSAKLSSKCLMNQPNPFARMLRNRSRAGYRFGFRRLRFGHWVPAPHESRRERLQCHQSRPSDSATRLRNPGGSIERQVASPARKPHRRTGTSIRQGPLPPPRQFHLFARIHRNLRVGKDLRLVSWHFIGCSLHLSVRKQPTGQTSAHFERPSVRLSRPEEEEVASTRRAMSSLAFKPMLTGSERTLIDSATIPYADEP